MSKRPNEDSQSDSAAKRTTIESSSEQQAIQLTRAAQEALDRLDFKTAEQICSQVDKQRRRIQSEHCLRCVFLHERVPIDLPNLNPLLSHNQLIDSDENDSAEPFIMRGISLERRAQAYEAIQDVEKALKEKANLQVSLRASSQLNH